MSLSWVPASAGPRPESTEPESQDQRSALATTAQTGAEWEVQWALKTGRNQAQHADPWRAGWVIGVSRPLAGACLVASAPPGDEPWHLGLAATWQVWGSVCSTNPHSCLSQQTPLGVFLGAPRAEKRKQGRHSQCWWAMGLLGTADMKERACRSFCLPGRLYSNWSC